MQCPEAEEAWDGRGGGGGRAGHPGRVCRLCPALHLAGLTLRLCLSPAPAASPRWWLWAQASSVTDPRPGPQTAGDLQSGQPACRHRRRRKWAWTSVSFIPQRPLELLGTGERTVFGKELKVGMCYLGARAGSDRPWGDPGGLGTAPGSPALPQGGTPQLWDPQVQNSDPVRGQLWFASTVY